ncbi:MAG: PrsW family intramembrane metalloprotease [Lachnospiraceae bacterium]|nr:PrsW family intramembrane metalloprotease [Lachnospiraceae bacterium]
MNYIENIFICLTAPLIISVLCLRGKGRRQMLFVILGMLSSLLSAYVSTFIAGAQGADLLSASMEISPLVEELMKIFPVVFYVLVFEAGREEITDSIMMIAIGFATFENAYYMTQSDSMGLIHLLIRGFGTGAMHVVCGYIIAIGLLRLWDKEWLRVAGTIALLAVAISYHGIFNILVSQTGVAAFIGYVIPVFTTVLNLGFRSKIISK